MWNREKATPRSEWRASVEEGDVIRIAGIQGKMKKMDGDLLPL